MNDLSRMMRLAGVDIGTLTCRLLIADLLPSGWLREVRSERKILRLGEGVDQTKQLSGAAMDRVLQCLKEWQEMIDASSVDAAAVVATSAVRDAVTPVWIRPLCDGLLHPWASQQSPRRGTDVLQM